MRNDKGENKNIFVSLSDSTDGISKIADGLSRFIDYMSKKMIVLFV